MTDWNAKAQDAITHFGARQRTFTEHQSLELIDFFVSGGTVTEAQMQAHGSKDFVATILGHVTTAVHREDSPPRKGSWYTRDATAKTYTVDSDFAAAWKSARGLP